MTPHLNEIQGGSRDAGAGRWVGCAMPPWTDGKNLQYYCRGVPLIDLQCTDLTRSHDCRRLDETASRSTGECFSHSSTHSSHYSVPVAEISIAVIVVPKGGLLWRWRAAKYIVFFSPVYGTYPSAHTAVLGHCCSFVLIVVACSNLGCLAFWRGYNFRHGVIDTSRCTRVHVLYHSRWKAPAR